MAELNFPTGGMPGDQNKITTQRLDYDGQWLTSVKIREQTGTVGAISPQEVVSGGVWTAYHDEPISDLLVFKVTETRAVPGLYVPFTRYDPQLGAINGTRRLVENSSLTTTLTATAKTTYEAHQNSKAVCWELIETNSDGTGSAGNPAFPIRVTDFYENDRGAVERTSQIVIAAGSEIGSLSVSGGTATLIRYEPQNQFHLDKIIETWAVPGPELVAEPQIDRDGAVWTVTRQLNLASAITEGESIVGGTTLTIVTSEPYSGQATGPMRWKETRTRALPGTAWTRAEVDGETQSPVAIVSQIIATPSFPITQVAGSDITYQPLSSVHGIKITTTLTGYAGLSIVDYPMGKYSAPPLLTAATLTSTASWDGTPTISVNYTIRPAITKEVVFGRTKTYGTLAAMQALQASLPIENLVLADIDIDPLFVPPIRKSGVLTNAITLSTYTTGTENPKYPYATESISWGATTPTATAYPGRTVNVSATVEAWKYNLFRLTTTEVETF